MRLTGRQSATVTDRRYIFHPYNYTLMMNDETHLQAAMRHHEEAAFLPWQALAPDEEMMAKEDGEGQGGTRRAWLAEELMVYLFGDKEPGRWENVAMRALAVFWHCLPGLLVGRDMGELDRVKRTAVIRRGFNLEEFVRLSADEDWRETLKGIMNFLYPARRNWMKKGTQRAYVLARAYQADLLATEKVVDGKRRKVEMTYEGMEEIFEGKLATEKERGRARAKWCALTQVVLRHPVEAAGGVAHVRFGKSASARAAMALSAKRTCNRRKSGGAGG